MGLDKISSDILLIKKLRKILKLNSKCLSMIPKIRLRALKLIRELLLLLLKMGMFTLLVINLKIFLKSKMKDSDFINYRFLKKTWRKIKMDLKNKKTLRMHKNKF